MKALLGYPSHISCVRALWKKGMTPEQIRDVTGLKLGLVRTHLSVARGRNRFYLSDYHLHQVVRIDRDSLHSLDAQAAARQMSVPALIRAVIATLAEEPHLVNAVLDDGVENV